MKKATLKDVAQRAGVSASSVSRYVSDPSSIKPIPALQVEKAIRELGYIPNTYAQGLKNGNSKTIGIIVPGLGPFFNSVCTALSDFFYQHKYLIYICNTDEDPMKERYYIKALIGQQAEGIIIALSGRTAEYVAEVSKQFPNIVLIDKYEKGLPVDSVYEDSYNSSYELTKHMISKGHRDFILLFRPKESTNTLHRLSGTEKALSEAGLDINDMRVHFDITTPEQTYAYMTENIRKCDKPVAVIGYSPFIMENIIIALNQLKIPIPCKVDLAGYVLDDFMPKFNSQIPCIIQNPYDLGIKAGDVLLKKLRRSSQKNVDPKAYCLPSQLIKG